MVVALTVWKTEHNQNTNLARHNGRHPWLVPADGVADPDGDRTRQAHRDHEHQVPKN